MASTLNGTGVTFSDGTALPSAAPSISQIGGLVSGWYTASGPANSSDNYYFNNTYAVNTTISGSSLAYNIVGAAYTGGSPKWQSYYFTFSPQPWNNGNSYAFPIRSGVVGTGGLAFSTSNSNMSSYSTSSGSWRSVTAFQITQAHYTYDNTTNCYWGPALWQRYA